MNLNNKVILITGASSGIGYELARQLARYNCKLALIARREIILRQVEKELKEINNNILTIKCDVSVQKNVKDAIRTTINFFRGIDIAILNAGINIKSQKNEFDSSAAKEIFNTNIIGMTYFFEELIPLFKESEGMFVGISSLADGRGFPQSGFYCASKAAVTLFLESQRVELKPFKIKVLTVRPGFVKTPMTDKNEFYMPFMINADKAAGIILSGIIKEKRKIQFPLPTVIGTKILNIIPDAWFESFAGKHLEGLQKKKL